MLKLYVDDRLLDLPQDIRIRIKRSNPAYLGEDVDVIKSGFSVPFDIPMTKRNRAILLQSGRPDSASRLPSDIPMKLYAGPDLFMAGRLNVLRANAKRAKVTFNNNALADVKKVKMSDLAIGGYSYSSAAALQANMRDTTVNPTDRPWLAFPLYNASLNPRQGFGENNDDQFQNAYDFSTGSFRQDLPLSLFLRAEFVLRAMMEAQGYTWTDLFHVTDEHRRIALVNNRALNKPGGVITLAAGYNTLLPETTVADFLKDYCRIFCLAPFASLNGDSITLQPLAELTKMAERRNWTEYANSEPEKENSDRLGRLGFTNSDESSGNNFGRWGDLGQPDVILESTIDDPREDTLYYLTARNVYARAYEQQDGSFLADFTYSNGSVENPLGDEEILPRLESVRQNQLLFYPDNNDNLLVPYWSRELATPIISDQEGGADVSHSLAIYRGLQPTSAGKLFPQGGINNYQVDLSRIAGEELSLRWPGDRGIYTNHWQLWDEMIQRSNIVKRTFLLPLTELLAFDFRDKVRVDNRNYFVRDIEFTIGMGGVSPTSSTLVAVP